MADTSLFKRLGRLFSSDVVIRNVGGDQLKVADVNQIQTITIASTGNATDFGDLTTANNGLAGVSNGSRGVFGGGSAPTIVNTIQFITIDTTGNATDFGDLIAATSGLAGSSNGHGGLQ